MKIFIQIILWILVIFLSFIFLGNFMFGEKIVALITSLVIISIIYIIFKKPLLYKKWFMWLGTIIACCFIMILTVSEPETNANKNIGINTTLSNVIKYNTTKKVDINTTRLNITQLNTTQEEVSENILASGNTVYGKLEDNNAKKMSDLMYFNEQRGIYYLVLEDSTIYQAEVSFDLNMGLNLDMDISFLSEHAHDYMEDDANLIQTLSPVEFIYESKKLQKQYEVMYSTIDGIVERVIISQH